MARKQKQEGGNDPNAWMVTFSDLLTLLLTFFVLLISMSSLDASAIQEAFESYSSISGPLNIDGPSSPSTGGQHDNLLVIRRSLIQAVALQKVRGGSDLSNTKLAGEDSGAARPGEDTPDEVTPEGPTDKPAVDDDSAGRLEDPEGLEIFVDERGLVVRMPSSITFGSGQASLTPMFREVLDMIAKTMKKNDLVVTIEGHSDDRPISTLRYPSNWELSMARAAAAARYLAENPDVSPGRLAAAGFADSRPIASNKSPLGRQKNRRVEVILNVNDTEEVKKLTKPGRESEING
jgi:chemotaxis protein MotB